MSQEDPTAESRKHDHIALAFKSRVESGELDARFYYDPALSAHPEEGSLKPLDFLGKQLRTPMWVSSMTGGTALARKINGNLARACAEFGMGMGLGSCRQLLNSNEFLPDFDVRNVIGPDLPLYANLGSAQIEQLLENKSAEKIQELIDKLQADGLIVHINPLQEAMQPEGDHFSRPPLEIVEEMISRFSFPVIVKEVGQGFGPASLRALMKLPLGAIEFGAAGGTNFALLELLRSNEQHQNAFAGLARVGHSASEMLEWTNNIASEPGTSCQTRHLIISGGVSDFLDGYYLTRRSVLPAVYGQASAFLRHAQGDYESLRTFVRAQVRGLELSNAFLTPR